MESLRSSTTTRTDHIYLVTGLSGGREFFLGEAVGLPLEGATRLSGKVLSSTQDGRFVVRPFRTMLAIREGDPHRALHFIEDTEAREEARALLELSATHIPEEAAPRLRGWIEGALASACPPSAHPTLGLGFEDGDSLLRRERGFRTTAAALRRVLLRTRHLRSSSALDRVTELEADLLLEMGKVVNRLMWRWNELASEVSGLSAQCGMPRAGEPEAQPDSQASLPVLELPASSPVSRTSPTPWGWAELWQVLSESVGWARERGRGELLGRLNSMLREGLLTLHGILSDHVSALDLLIAECLGEYGIEQASELVPAAARLLGSSVARDPGGVRAAILP